MDNSKVMERSEISDKAAAGAAIYNSFVLALYDIEVLMFEMPLIFKCPLSKVKKLYDDNISDNHLDIGVGTGYFLHKAKFNTDSPVIHLMDLNPNSLKKTAKRIKRYSPASHMCNVLEPVNFDLPMFDSMGAANFLHCLPGKMEDKELFFKNLLLYLKEGGTFFGTTVIGKDIKAGRIFKTINKIYNDKGIFCNLHDSLEDLQLILSKNFREYQVDLEGTIALFRGVK